ncbi:MAG: type II secretion system protein M [Arenicellales bacterium]|jgi:general secretion pathway protein M
MNALTERLTGLSTREQVVLVGGGVLALVVVLYTLAWRPWQEELNRLRIQVPEEEQTLAWMRTQAAQVDSLTKSSNTAAEQTGLPLLTLVERSANEVEIRKAITRMSPGDKDNQVRVWMDKADFDLWLRWLKALQAAGIEVADANIDRASENKVNIRATLQR